MGISKGITMNFSLFYRENLSLFMGTSRGMTIRLVSFYREKLLLSILE